MSTAMPRSALRHRPIASDVQTWKIATPQALGNQQHASARTLLTQTRQAHPLALIGVSMLTTFLLFWAIQGLWLWSTIQLDTLKYGYPRTSQIDHAVGHGGLSHFIATNQRGQIYVLEIPDGDPANSHLLIGPHVLGANADLTPVTLAFQGDPRHPDLIVDVQSIQTRFQNTGKTYIPAAP